MRLVWQGSPAVPGKAPQVDIHTTNEEQDAGSALLLGRARKTGLMSNQGERLLKFHRR